MIISGSEAATRKPVIDLTGPQGNVMYLVAMYHRTLKDHGLTQRQVREAVIEWTKGKTYAQIVDQWLTLVGDSVDVVIPDDVLEEINDPNLNEDWVAQKAQAKGLTIEEYTEQLDAYT